MVSTPVTIVIVVVTIAIVIYLLWCCCCKKVKDEQQQHYQPQVCQSVWVPPPPPRQPLPQQQYHQPVLERVVPPSYTITAIRPVPVHKQLRQDVSHESYPRGYQPYQRREILQPIVQPQAHGLRPKEPGIKEDEGYRNTVSAKRKIPTLVVHSSTVHTQLHREFPYEPHQQGYEYQDRGILQPTQPLPTESGKRNQAIEEDEEAVKRHPVSVKKARRALLAADFSGKVYFDENNVLQTFKMCGSKRRAYEEAKVAGGGKEPMLHGPHKRGDKHHYHVNRHTDFVRLIDSVVVLENPHFQFPHTI